MSHLAATPARLIQTEQLKTLLDLQAQAVTGVAVQAPGGHGKTALLRELSRLYESDDLMLVDDAHLLDDMRLRELRALAGSGGRRLLVAYRPWPRPAALVELTDVLKRQGPPVVLGPFDRDQTHEYVTAVLGLDPKPEAIRFLQEQTYGVPGYVDRLARALVEHGEGVAASVIMQFGPDLDDVAGDVRRVLLAAATGVELSTDVLRGLLSCGPEEVDSVLAAARATGLMAQDGTLPPIVRQAVTSLSPASYRDSVWRDLARLQLRRGGPVLPMVRSLHTAGADGAQLAEAFEAAADEALADEPALAARLFATAAAPARQALAAALAGDLDSALRLADRLLANESADRAGTAVVAATALAHRGQLGRSAELYRWSGQPQALAFAAIADAATGRIGDLDHLLAQPPTGGPPTLLTGASMLMARGVGESLTGPAAAAVSTLAQAAALLEPAGRAALLPDSPAALAALVGVHCGELDIGESVLERAIGSGMGSTLMSRRHLLLQAWILMVQGKTAVAAERLGAASVAIGPSEPRDLLFATALEVGIARRNSDPAALGRAWVRAREAVVLHPVDLFTLLPLGELAIAAARLGELGRLLDHLREARLLLERLGNPPLWATPLHWSSLHAAMAVDEPGLAEEHVAALTGAASHTRYGTAVAAAGESWLAVMRGVVEQAKVEAAARALHDIGLSWDGARLAGQAAIRTADRKAMTALLDCARMIQGKPVGRQQGPVADAFATATGEGRLSEREQEVADLVLAGLTYKQIGDKLFISAKTVEHHVARMRQRLNCASRSDLLAKLRTMAADRAAAPARVPWPRQPSP